MASGSRSQCIYEGVALSEAITPREFDALQNTCKRHTVLYKYLYAGMRFNSNGNGDLN